MSRRVWIIAKKERIEQSDIDDAVLNGCPEIANGIPPALRGIVAEKQLPCVYEEPAPLPPSPVRDLCSEIDQIKADIEVIKTKVGLEGEMEKK